MARKEKVYKNYQEFLMDELQDPEVALEYLNETLKDKDPNVFLTALRDVLKAQHKDFTTLAKDTNISRQHLYRLLSEEGNPRWINLNTIFETLGFQVQLAPKK